MQIHRGKHLTSKQSSRILMYDRDRSIGAKICSEVQGAIWEAFVHRESKGRPFMQLLPVPPLLSVSQQTSPPSSRLILSVHWGPTNQYNCSLSQASGLQLALASPYLPASFPSLVGKAVWKRFMLLAKEHGEPGERCYAAGKWTKRPLLSNNPSSLVPSALVTTYPPSLQLQIPISCSPALQHPPHFLLQPTSRWRRMSPAWCAHSRSLFAPWVCGIPDGLWWFTSSHIHMSSRVEEFSTKCRGLDIIPFNNPE